jgi:hypothetical protein
MQKLRNINRLIRLSVILGCIGLFCILLFLLFGFQAWSVGVGMFLGFPVPLIAVILYIIAVVRDLSGHHVMED